HAAEGVRLGRFVAEAHGGPTSWQPELDELRRRESFAEQLGGPERVQRQRDGGRLTIRERIEKLVDPRTLHEVGKIAGTPAYARPTELKGLPPSNFVSGGARIAGRPWWWVATTSRCAVAPRTPPSRVSTSCASRWPTRCACP